MANFTKLHDDVIEKLGVYAAAVYGRVERYCQMERNECSAKMGTIALSLNIGESTVREKLKLLVEAGYLIRAQRGKLAVYTLAQPIPIALVPSAIEESTALSPETIALAPVPIAPKDSAYRASSQRVEETVLRDIYQETVNNNIRADVVENQFTQSEIPKYTDETLTPLADELIGLGMWQNVAVDCVNRCEPDEVHLGIVEYQRAKQEGKADSVAWLASGLKLRKFLRADYSIFG